MRMLSGPSLNHRGVLTLASGPWRSQGWGAQQLQATGSGVLRLAQAKLSLLPRCDVCDNAYMVS